MTTSILDLPLDQLPKAQKRFWSKVQKTEGCWIWKAGKSRGYGRFSIKRRQFQIVAHRFSYELVKGRIPKGLTLDHLCRNPSCVNPDHLEAVSQKENTLRGIGRAAQNAWQIYCKNGGHLLSGDNLSPYFLKRGIRSCRICHNEWQRKYRQQRKSAQQSTLK